MLNGLSVWHEKWSAIRLIKNTGQVCHGMSYIYVEKHYHLHISSWQLVPGKRSWESEGSWCDIDLITHWVQMDQWACLRCLEGPLLSTFLCYKTLSGVPEVWFLALGSPHGNSSWRPQGVVRSPEPNLLSSRVLPPLPLLLFQRLHGLHTDCINDVVAVGCSTELHSWSASDGQDQQEPHSDIRVQNHRPAAEWADDEGETCVC